MLETKLLKAYTDFKKCYGAAEKVLKSTEAAPGELTASAREAKDKLVESLPGAHERIGQLEFVSKNHRMHDGTAVTTRIPHECICRINIYIYIYIYKSPGWNKRSDSNTNTTHHSIDI